MAFGGNGNPGCLARPLVEGASKGEKDVVVIPHLNLVAKIVQLKDQVTPRVLHARTFPVQVSQHTFNLQSFY